MSLSKILGFYPDNLQIYEQALLHKSSSVETDDGKWLNNERLEFLGDGILDAAVADIVYKRYPNKREGLRHTPIAQEEENDDDNQYKGLIHRLLHLVDRSADKLGIVKP